MTRSADHEEERLRVLQESEILLTGPNPVLDAICQEATRHFEVPISLVTIVDCEKLWVKAVQGMAASELPRDTAFCAYTILSDNVFVIPDMLADDRFETNPLVFGAPRLRFYAGAPLVYLRDIRLGSVCVLDTKPRTFSPGDKAELREMADRAVAEIAAQELKALALPPTGPPQS